MTQLETELRSALINLLNCEAYGTKGAAWKNSSAHARAILARMENPADWQADAREKAARMENMELMRKAAKSINEQVTPYWSHFCKFHRENRPIETRPLEEKNL